MEGSMSLKKRAIEGIVVAGSLVMMSTIAQAADLDGVQVRNAAVQAETARYDTGGISPSRFSHRFKIAVYDPIQFLQ